LTGPQRVTGQGRCVQCGEPIALRKGIAVKYCSRTCSSRYYRDRLDSGRSEAYRRRHRERCRRYYWLRVARRFAEDALALRDLTGSAQDVESL